MQRVNEGNYIELTNQCSSIFAFFCTVKWNTLVEMLMNPLRPISVTVKYLLNECEFHREGIVALSKYDEERIFSRPHTGGLTS
jgi:hypothetical protein